MSLEGISSLKCTVMCLSIGTPKNNEFSIVPNGNLIIFRCSKFWTNYSLTMIGLNIGTPKKIINFPFGTNGNSVILSVPIFEHFRVLRRKVFPLRPTPIMEANRRVMK